MPASVSPYTRARSFFFQAEDGRRGTSVTGVQTCALPIFGGEEARLVAARAGPDLEHRVALVVGVLGEKELLERRVERGQPRLERGQLAARQLAQLGEIGRASCREGVEGVVSAMRTETVES